MFQLRCQLLLELERAVRCGQDGRGCGGTLLRTGRDGGREGRFGHYAVGPVGGIYDCKFKVSTTLVIPGGAEGFDHVRNEAYQHAETAKEGRNLLMVQNAIIEEKSLALV